MKHRHKEHKKAKGGEVMDEKAHPHEYNAKGSPEASEAMDEKDGFKRGGKKKASGGAVHGMKAARRLDKRARGGKVDGKSPFSSAKAETLPAKGDKGAGDGHEDTQPSDRD